ncbi:40S ribosomal protein S16 (nucleomorph) [Chroomonas mesostigmatica CCMP1168]|uniref:40S ribosomal protein S16 n=1 Tax=Chroomonas mesostigmatica CCMP1168 TaxID=1195612 RepID=J7GB33_9CRYP|nr:40S ribosomal protein S16 [Chroomonas mesostigmatica CCMP1168]|mmetsp:Transcript_58816/g.144202  ORF Transcript_58816/g.144202 Transcript_58816/m.144202 type:complete len:143 (+) Transcript_58816:2516-2944(+)
MKNIVQVFGKKKTSIAVAVLKGPGNGFVRINGVYLDAIEPEILKFKAFEPFFSAEEFGIGDIDIRIRVKGGGQISQIYAIRQAIARGLIKYFEKFVDENKRTKLHDFFLNYDRSLLVRDPRENEPKKAGGKGARSRYQKSYR